MELLQQKLGGAANVTPEAMRNLLMQQVRAQNEQGAARPFPDLITDEPRPNPVATPTVQRTSAAPGARMPTPPIPPGTPAPQTTASGPPAPALNANLGGNPYGDPYGVPQPNLGQQVVSGAPAVPPTTSAAPPAATTVTPAPSATSTEPTLDLNVTGNEPLDMAAVVDQAVAPARVSTTAAPTPPVASTAAPDDPASWTATTPTPRSDSASVVSPETQDSMPPRMPTAADIGIDINDPNFQRALVAAIGIGGPLALAMSGRKGTPMSDNAKLFADENAAKPGPRTGKSADTTKGPPSTPDSGAKSGPRVAKATTPPASRGTMNDTFTFNEPTVGGNILRGQPVQEPPVSEPKPAPRARTNSPKSAVPTSKAAQAANPTKFPPIPKSAVVPVDIPPARPVPRTVTPTPAPPPPVEAPVLSPGMLRGGVGPVAPHDPTAFQAVTDALAKSPRPPGAIGGVSRAAPTPKGMGAAIPFVGGVDPSKTAMEMTLELMRQFNMGRK